jgi:hypothetical protein
LQSSSPSSAGLLLPVEGAKSWPFYLDLAVMEADLALRFPPAVRRPIITFCKTGAMDRLRIVVRPLSPEGHGDGL